MLQCGSIVISLYDTVAIFLAEVNSLNNFSRRHHASSQGGMESDNASAEFDLHEVLNACGNTLLESHSLQHGEEVVGHETPQVCGIF